MHSRPSKPPKTYTGSYKTIQLDFTPELPESPEHWSKVHPNYPMELASVQIYLDGEDAAPSDWVPAAYCMSLFEDLLRAVPAILAGKAATAHWFSSPCQFDLYGEPQRGLVRVTVHSPKRWTLLKEVVVPMDVFVQEVIRVSTEWLKYLNEIFNAEISHPELGEDYRRFKQQLHEAQRAAY